MTMDRRTIIAIAICVLFLLLYPQVLRWAGLGRYLDPQRRTAVAPADTAGRGPGSAAARREDAPATANPPAPVSAAGEAARAGDARGLPPWPRPRPRRPSA